MNESKEETETPIKETSEKEVSSLDVHKSRKRKRSCENCVDESVQLKNSNSMNGEQSEDSIEPLIKCRRLFNIEGSSVPEYSNNEMGLKDPEGSSLEEHISSRHSLALKESCEDNIDKPTETDSLLDGGMSDHSLEVADFAHESSKTVATEDACKIDENEDSECNCEICDHWMALTLSFLPCTSLPVDSSQDIATKDGDNLCENENSELSWVIGKLVDHWLAVKRSFASFISTPIDKVSSLDVLESLDAVAAKQAGKMGENGFSECSKVSILDVYEPAEARNRRQRKRKGNNVDQSVRQSEDVIEPLRKYRRQCNVEEDAVLAVSQDELCDNEAVEKENHQSDSNHVSPSSQLPCDVPVNSEEAAVPTVSKDELCGNEAVEKDNHKPDSSHDSASSKLPCDVPVNVEGMALNSDSLEMFAKNKTEEPSVSVGALASDEDTPDTMSYVRYYLRTAYQLLLRAMVRDPVGSTPLESSIF
ncbi:uncharacterized protein LOC144663574 [Oculina patagonica]